MPSLPVWKLKGKSQGLSLALLPPPLVDTALTLPHPRLWLPPSQVSPSSLIYFQEGVWKT